MYEPYEETVLVGDPAEAVTLIAYLADSAPDDDHLRALAISLIETFLAVRDNPYPLFLAAMEKSSKLRTAWCHAWSVVPEEWGQRSGRF
ncbi:MAG TPA: hypothetical protein VHT75_02730 [Acidimicrobiales bacterium]|jgi:hypothetical protein|nr:hypothetical protein [Acidimicrobiales bacterium]